MPPLVIILITSNRLTYALRTIQAVHNNLICHEYGWYVAFDHASDSHVDVVVSAVSSGANVVGWHTENIGYGAAVNLAIERIGKEYPITLWLEEDWELSDKSNVVPYMQMLTEREDVSCLRLGHLPINLDLESYGHNGNMYLNVKKNRQYAFSGNPHLKHRRFYDAYGMYPTGLNPGDTEIAYDSQVRSKDGPMIWWPLMIGDRFLWQHIGQERSY